MKKKKLPKIISVLVLTLLTSIVWVSLSVYRSFTVKPTPSVPEEISKPLNPTLDQNTITKIESRIFFEDSQISETIIPTVETPTPTPISTPSITPTPVASPISSSTPSPTP